MRLVFLGTPAFAVPTLERDRGGGPRGGLAVFTQPDRPKGRGQQPAAPPVKEAALRLGLPVYQPERVRRPEAVEHLRGDCGWTPWWWWVRADHSADRHRSAAARDHQRACVAAAEVSRRGSDPVGDRATAKTRTGVTTMRIDAGLDTGDMLLKAETEIGPEENALELGSGWR